MKNMSWIVGLGVIAVAVIRYVFARRQKGTMEKMMDWSKTVTNPMSHYVMRAGKRMVKGMVK